MTTGQYEASVRKYHPQGWDHSFWAGVTRRVGSSRVTDICGHRHATQPDAEACAERLAAGRNAKLGVRKRDLP